VVVPAHLGDRVGVDDGGTGGLWAGETAVHHFGLLVIAVNQCTLLSCATNTSVYQCSIIQSVNSVRK
jgi:hypothetical protein